MFDDGTDDRLRGPVPRPEARDWRGILHLAPRREGNEVLGSSGGPMVRMWTASGVEMANVCANLRVAL